MQKTKFSFEIIINDDASTDKTSAIIRDYESEYPELIKPKYHIKNQYSQGVRGIAIKFTFTRARGKYIAMCEGDDYWTDPYKLQKQVDFLEAHSDYGMIHTDHSVLFEKNGELVFSKNSTLERNPSSGIIFNDLLEQNSVMTLTTLFRKDLVNDILERYKDAKIPFIDYFLWLHLASSSKIKYLDEVTACYRVVSGSITHDQDKLKRAKFIDGVFKIKLYFLNRYAANNKSLQNKIRTDYLKFKLKASLVSSIFNLDKAELKEVTLKSKKERVIWAAQTFKLGWLLRAAIKFRAGLR